MCSCGNLVVFILAYVVIGHVSLDLRFEYLAGDTVLVRIVLRSQSTYISYIIVVRVH